jgi:ABC-2 type transport system permease protein
MMKVLVVAYYEFIKNLRDIKMLAFLIIFPVITTLILGTSIEGYFSGDSAKRISVVYINKDKGAIGKEFDKFLENEEIIKRLDIKRLNDKTK